MRRKKVSLFAGQEDLKIYAAKGKFDIQAQDNVLDASARLDIKITSSEGKVEINSPKEIVLRAKESALRIDASGVTVITPQKFTAKAGQHLLQLEQVKHRPYRFFQITCVGNVWRDEQHKKVHL